MSDPAECRMCHRPLRRSTGIGPVCARRERAALAPAVPPAALQPKRRPTAVSRPAGRKRPSAIPGQTSLDWKPQMPADRYRPKTAEIAALQWTGDNIAEMDAFAGFAFDYDVGSPEAGQPPEASLLATRHSSWTPMHPGDWAVRDADGKWSRVPADEFAETYEAAGADA